MERGVMATDFSLSLWEREGARSAQPSGKGEDRYRASALTLPALCASLPLPQGEGL
ncbi:hypothetical protein ACVWYO_003014 [Sphingomonas sp. UYP23]